MYFGINSDGNKVHIENSVKGDSYSCPICGTPLIRKFGSIVSHHFAHKSAQCDPWYSDNKGPWHKEMQSHFRPEQCEVRIDGKCGKFHIADIFIEHTDRPNTIIEFQHSSISIEEFDERNNFYTTNNTNDNYDYNEVIWVFDYNHKDMFIDIFKYSDIQNLFEEKRKLEEEERLFEQKCAAIYTKREKYAQINPLEPKNSPLRKEAKQNQIDMEQTWIEREELQNKKRSIENCLFNLLPIEPQEDSFCYELIKHVAEAKLRKDYHLKYKKPVEELYFGRDHIAQTADWLICKNSYTTHMTLPAETNDYVSLTWKRASHIFSNTIDNPKIQIYFDVTRRKYIRTYDYTYKFMQELYKKYENYGFTEFDDTIDNFFVYVSSIYPEKGQLNMNHQLAHNPSELHGRCLMHEDFFKFYGIQ